MRLDKARQWVGAVYAEDTDLMSDMLDEDPSLADSVHLEFDDPYREKRFPVATLRFAVAGPPQQQITWRQVERVINRDVVCLLLDRGADPNVYCVYGHPLSAVRQRDIAELLIERGADINLWHDNGGSPLWFPIWQADPERLRMFLDLGADPGQIDPETGESALHMAVLCAGRRNDSSWIADEFIVLQILLKAGVDLHRKTKVGCRSNARNCPELHGETPLHFAAAHATEDFIKELLKFGADKTTRNAKGDTARDFAIKHNRPKVIEDLLA